MTSIQQTETILERHHHGFDVRAMDVGEPEVHVDPPLVLRAYWT